MFRHCLAGAVAVVLALAAQPAYAQRIPSGSYQQSCVNARVRGAQLTAECSSARGSRITSSTSVNCDGDIGNVDGYLRCNGRGHDGGYGGRLPSGSYRQSCVNARMNGSRLTAACTSTRGSRITSSLDVNSCRRNADIGNRNGYLGCDRR